VRISEKCSCGAEFVAEGLVVEVVALQWRQTHPCKNRTKTQESEEARRG
jgi:hypothetical protein